MFTVLSANTSLEERSYIAHAKGILTKNEGVQGVGKSMTARDIESALYNCRPRAVNNQINSNQIIPSPIKNHVELS